MGPNKYFRVDGGSRYRANFTGMYASVRRLDERLHELVTQ